MIYERTNGNGKAYGYLTDICRASILDRYSYAADKADIWQSDLRFSRVIGDTKVRATLAEFSTLGCSRLPSETVQSHIVRSNLRGGSVIKAYVENSVIRGKATVKGIGEGVRIIDSIIKGHAIIEGEAVVMGITVDRCMRISHGFWSRRPRYVEIEANGVIYGVTESTNGYAHIGCNHRKMTDWIRKSSLWAKAAGWAQEQGDEIAEVFTGWLAEPMAGNER